MKTFRQFITEGTATEIKELIFTDDNYEYPIPFSQPMWERITSVKRWGYGMHVTDQEDVVKVVRMQGKKNQLSTMTKMRNEIDSFLKGGGILTEGGVFCTLKGTVVQEMGEDFATSRDTQGRRWLQAGKLYQRYWHGETFDGWGSFVNEIQQMRQKGHEQIIQAQNQNPKLQKKYGVKAPDYDTPEEYWRSDDINSWTDIGEYGTGKEKAAAIKWYMDGVEKILKQKKYLEQMQKMLLMGKNSGDIEGWDEWILSEFEIMKIIYHPSKVYSKGNLALGDASQLIANVKRAGYKGPIVELTHGDVLREEMLKIHNLNGRIFLNAKKAKFNFPTDYDSE